MPIKKLIEDPTNSFIAVGRQNFYFCQIEKRKPFEGMIEISLKDFGLKINEIIDAINILETRIK